MKAGQWAAKGTMLLERAPAGATAREPHHAMSGGAGATGLIRRHPVGWYAGPEAGGPDHRPAFI